MSKVEQAIAIPKPGHKSPESAHSEAAPKLDGPDQSHEDQRLMPVEIALVRALQQLGGNRAN